MAGQTYVYFLNFLSRERHIINKVDGKLDDKTEVIFEPGADINELGDFENMMNENLVGDSDNLYVNFVDPYYKVNKFYTDEGKKYYNSVSKIRRSDMSEFITFHDVDWAVLRDSVTIDSDSNYFFITSDDFVNSYDFFNYLGIKISNNVYVRYGAKSFGDVFGSLERFIGIYGDEEQQETLPLSLELVNPFNVYGGIQYGNYQDSYGNEPTYDHDAIEWIIENGITHVEFLKKSGVHYRERFMLSNIPSWCLNVSSHYMMGIILEYELLPMKNIFSNDVVVTGKTPQEKFLESSEYRARILEYMIKTILFLFVTDVEGKIVNPYSYDLSKILNTLSE